MVVKICITNNVIEVEPSAKTFNGNLYRGGDMLTLGEPFLIRLLNVSLRPWILQCSNRIQSAQLRLITRISISIRMMRPSKYHQIVINEQLDSSPNVIKASDIFLTLGVDEIVQQIILINKSVTKDIFAPKFKYCHKKA